MIYLDNAATTAISPKVMDVLKESMESDFANPGTIYSIGLDAKKKVEQKIIADLLEDIEESNIPFCVDIVDINAIDQSMREQIINERISWT